MLAFDIPGGSFLDLFSGSGAIGIEALSRGARKAVFIENNKKASHCIRENLKFTRLEEGATVMECDVFAGLKRLEERREAFDIIFMDPPYTAGYEKPVLEYLSGSKLVDEDTLIVVEAKKETDFSFLKDLNFKVQKRKEYKTNVHMFLTLGEK